MIIEHSVPCSKELGEPSLELDFLRTLRADTPSTGTRITASTLSHTEVMILN